MIRPAVVASSLLFFVVALNRQTSSAQQTVRLEVRLSYDNTRQLTAVEGTPGVSANTRTEGGRTPVKDAAAMQIQVELQDGFGKVIQERNSDQEGRVFFDIPVPARDPRREFQPTPSFRLRVFGLAIDEVMIEGLDPIHGERVVHIPLRRKKADAGQPHVGGSAGGSTVSLGRLQVPPKAGKELEKGNHALKDGDLDSAERHFKAAIKAYPDYDQAYNNLGVVLMQKGSAVEARRAFEKAVAVNDHFARAFTNLGKLALMQQNPVEADGFLRRSLENDPWNPEVLMLAAEAALFIGKLDDAVNDVRILHTLPHEKYALGHFIAGRAYEAQTKFAEASTEYQVFLKEEPNSPNAARAKAALERLKARP